jgi:thiol-disulfide isomerase/thioredoxin
MSESAIIGAEPAARQSGIMTPFLPAVAMPMQTSTFRPRLAVAAALLAGLSAMAGGRAMAADALLKPWPAGQATPALRLTDLEGKEWQLSRLRGKVVVVNFWAGWCGPCVEELPVLNALARRDPDKVAVVGVNYKEPLDSIERFAADHPFAYPVLRDRAGETFRQWTAGVMPTTVLIDRRGRARWRSAGGIGAGDTRLQAAIDALVAE